MANPISKLFQDFGTEKFKEEEKQSHDSFDSAFNVVVEDEDNIIVRKPVEKPEEEPVSDMTAEDIVEAVDGGEEEEEEPALDEFSEEVSEDTEASTPPDGEEASDVKRVVRAGKVVKVSNEKLREQAKQKKKPRGGLTPAQYRARVKNARKAHTPAAKAKRAKSLKKRQQKGLDSVDISSMTLKLRTLLYDAFVTGFNIENEKVMDFASDVFSNNVDIQIEDSVMTLSIPSWDASSNFSLKTFNPLEERFQLDDNFDESDILSGIIDDYDVISKVFRTVNSGDDEE